MYHITKAHWNGVDLNSDVSEEEIKRMIDHSYELVVRGLTKKLQKELRLIED